MRKEPLRFEVEYSIVNPPWEKGRPKYTAKVAVTDQEALEALGCPHVERLERELGMHFWDWSAMQDHVARLIGTICEEIARGQLPQKPLTQKGETARLTHSIAMGAVS
jgi:hypothetical protein